MTSGGDRSEAPFEAPDRMRARRRRRWIVYTAAIAAVSFVIIGASWLLAQWGLPSLAFNIMTLFFPPFWIAERVMEALLRRGWVVGSVGITRGIALWHGLVYLFLYLFVAGLPSFYRRKVLGISWWLFQIIVLLPGIGCGICYWWFFA